MNKTEAQRERFAALVTEHSRSMYRAARALLPGDADAQDAVGEAVLLAWQSFEDLRKPEAARGWLFRAVAQAPHLREPWVDMARLLYEREEWDGVLYFTGKALEIKERPLSYICEAEPWGPLPHDLRCQAYYHTGRRAAALEAAKQALALAPGDQRLAGNVEALSR